MKRLLTFVLGVLLVSTSAYAQDPGKEAGGKESAKAVTAEGTVSAVSPNALTLKAKGSQWTFAVDKSTRVRVAGATRKTAAAQDAKEPLHITQYVKVGDLVTVTYHDMGDTKHAANVRVRSSLPATK